MDKLDIPVAQRQFFGSHTRILFAKTSNNNVVYCAQYI